MERSCLYSGCFGCARDADTLSANQPRYVGQVQSLLFDGANSAALLHEATSGTEFRIALPQTGEFAHLSVGQAVTFGFDPQRVVCFAAGTSSNAHVFS